MKKEASHQLQKLQAALTAAQKEGGREGGAPLSPLPASLAQLHMSPRQQVGGEGGRDRGKG